VVCVNGEEILNLIQDEVSAETGQDFEIKYTVPQLFELEEMIIFTIKKWSLMNGIRLGVDVIHEVETYTPNNVIKTI
jgi:hypothetical protein